MMQLDTFSSGLQLLDDMTAAFSLGDRAVFRLRLMVAQLSTVYASLMTTGNANLLSVEMLWTIDEELVNDLVEYEG